MKKIYKKLTKEQLDRNVIFSSTFSKHRTEQSDDTCHELTGEWNAENERSEGLLLDDTFFNSCESYNFNIVRR